MFIVFLERDMKGFLFYVFIGEDFERMFLFNKREGWEWLIKNVISIGGENVSGCVRGFFFFSGIF